VGKIRVRGRMMMAHEVIALAVTGLKGPRGEEITGEGNWVGQRRNHRGESSKIWSNAWVVTGGTTSKITAHFFCGQSVTRGGGMVSEYVGVDPDKVTFLFPTLSSPLKHPQG